MTITFSVGTVLKKRAAVATPGTADRKVLVTELDNMVNQIGVTLKVLLLVLLFVVIGDD